MTRFALVDVNNFYASCERLFRPGLAGRPIIVLSNNDGCVVARSAESKALGIRMGEPVFRIRDTIRRHGITVFSSNYALYADMSARCMHTLEAMAPRMEVYSIDEAFLDLGGLEAMAEPVAYGRAIRARIARWVGLPVCVGMGPTKTLAKLANYGAKHYPATGGVVDLSDPARAARLMALTPVDEVWGVGARTARRLQAYQVATALELARLSPARARKAVSVVLEKTVRELNGVSCLALEEVADARQQIVCSRSFAHAVTTRDELGRAIAGFAGRAAEKLRREGRRAGLLSIFFRTSPFNDREPQFGASRSARFAVPTLDSREILGLAGRLLDACWREGYGYRKAGVMLGEFSRATAVQGDLFAAGDSPRSTALMSTMDTINRHLPGGQVWLARQGSPASQCRMRREHLSPAYTTRWSDLPRARCS